MLLRSLSRKGGFLCRSRVCLPEIARRHASGGGDLSVQELREQLALAVRKADREELLKLYNAASRIPGRRKSTAPPVQIQSEVGANVELKPSDPHPYATGCYATKDFLPGDVVIEITGEVTSDDTFESLQIREGQHLQMCKPAVFLNHSCKPNGFIDFANLQYKALKNIKKGDQLTWDYNTTEWEIQRTFDCHECGKTVRGFKYLDDADQKALIERVSPYILDLYKQKEIAGGCLPN